MDVFTDTPDSMDIPLLDVQLVNQDDVAYTDPTESYWMDKKGREGSPFVLGRILRTDKDTGTMKVVGVSEDIAVEVPIPSAGSVSTDQLGDVSQPAAGAQVLLARTDNEDFYPIIYFRNFSEDQGFNYGVPDEIQEGDLGWITKGGGKLFIFENGMVQLESSPNCVRLMHPLDNGEKMSDICREYELFTDAGNISAKRRAPIGNSVVMKMEASERAGTDPDPLARISLGALNDAGTETGIYLQSLSANIKGVETQAASVKLTKDGKSLFESAVSAMHKAPLFTVESSKINLGDEKVTESAVLGLQLKARLDALEAHYNVHSHVVASGPGGGTASPFLPPLQFINPIDYLSKTVFLK